MERLDWRANRYLTGLSEHLDDYDLFSFDVFDTVLYRRCEKPVDAFAMVWKAAKEYFPELPMTPQEYLEMRRVEEQKSKKKYHPHQGYDIIFEEMPFDKRVIDFLMQEEIEVEKQIAYLNPWIYSLITELQALKKEVILVSDMYHSTETIIEILKAAGFDLSFAGHVFVSSKYDCYKGGGALFEIVLSHYPGLDRSRTIHIGDSENADYKGARAAGMDALLYGK